MRTIKAIFTKQMLSYFKNVNIIATPITFAIMAVVFTLFIPDADDAFGNWFAVMFIGMSMLGAAASFIIEDRATMNLRFMSMAGVSAYQYLVATATALFVSSVGFLVFFALLGGNFGVDFIEFMAITILGAITSICLGITLGLSKTPWLFQPVSMVLAFGIMIADANETVARYFYFVYTQQINLSLRSGYEYEEGYGYIYQDAPNAIQIILVNLGIVLICFIYTNYKQGLYRDAR